MRSRRLIAAAILSAAGLGAAGWGWYYAHSNPDFTPAQCDRPRPGMTRQEVRAVLGCPPGNYLTRPARPLDGFQTWDTMPGVRPTEDADNRRIGDACMIDVVFDQAGRVERAVCLPTMPTTEEATWWDWVKRRLLP